MTYNIKEMFFTLQGEGRHTGRAAVFCRFAGCNLWSGREEDRKRAICTFCDTDFVGVDGKNGGKYRDAYLLATEAKALWDHSVSQNVVQEGKKQRPFIVCTGGEPLLQLDEALILAFHEVGFEIAVETNGTMKSSSNIDWVCVSPKSMDRLVQRSGDEIKLIYPQENLKPEQFEHMDFKHFYLQPMDKKGMTAQHTEAAIEYCLKNPQWRLSIQTHKILGIA